MVVRRSDKVGGGQGHDKDSACALPDWIGDRETLA